MEIPGRPPPKSPADTGIKCIQFEVGSSVSLSETTNVLQLVIRSRGNSSECSHSVLENVTGLCLSPVLPDRQMPDQDQIGRDPLGAADYPPVEIPDMVPTTSRNVGRTTNSTPQHQQPSYGSTRETTPQGHLPLVAWSASGVPSKVKTFPRELSRFCVHHGGVTQLTPAVGESGRDGALKRVSLPFLHL